MPKMRCCQGDSDEDRPDVNANAWDGRPEHGQFQADSHQHGPAPRPLRPSPIGAMYITPKVRPLLKWYAQPIREAVGSKKTAALGWPRIIAPNRGKTLNSFKGGTTESIPHSRGDERQAEHVESHRGDQSCRRPDKHSTSQSAVPRWQSAPVIAAKITSDGIEMKKVKVRIEQRP